MAKLSTCKSCGKDVAKSAKSCPNCGAKLKHGLCFKILIALIIAIIVAVIFSPSKEDRENAAQQEMDSLISAPTENISIERLKDIFKVGSDATDIQRENTLKDIKGKVVSWSLPVYEVKKLAENKYKIQTESRYLGTFIKITARSPEEVAYLESLKTGDTISFKGILTGETSGIRQLDIEPAIILQ